ncbi:MAG TPA: hypothetical protein VL221_10890, partial [Bacteroidota bacterium]|nr:hypothetical protein [Bacteroidota bacterium]
MIRHSLRTTSFLTVVTLSLSHAAAQVPVGQDTIVIPGDTFHGRLNAGLMETTINGDTTPTGARANPNRVYALNQGQYYHQLAPIYCYNPTGMLTICGIPSPYGTTKPVILITPVPPSTQEGTNTVYGSITCDGIHYQA